MIRSFFRHASCCRLLLLVPFLVACTTSPTSGRSQLNILPGSLETTVPDLRYEVKTLLVSSGSYCPEEQTHCPERENAERLAQRIGPMAEQLGLEAARLSPELAQRVPGIEVFVTPGNTASISSSAGGKIAIEAGIASLDLSDTDLAFALGRELGRLAAAHHRESTSAGLMVSLIAGSPLTSTYLATTLLADIIFPVGILAKLGISMLASLGTEQLVEASQQAEADLFASRLLRATGYDPRELGKPIDKAPQDGIPIGWLATFLASRASIAAQALPDPWPDDALPSIFVSPEEPWPDDIPELPALAAEAASLAAQSAVQPVAPDPAGKTSIEEKTDAPEQADPTTRKRSAGKKIRKKTAKKTKRPAKQQKQEKQQATQQTKQRGK